ncbi:hypothetical protein [Dictyobacter kobayashii]|uniref:Uncharacterized protein n=1 Tax=Dictyobacter kobayashii TaxID=2014872 RepID=A0A402ATU8_9CHLR|nr:hypothetical protein [Dictyobacter kobayashii]GCE22528.1 hypothetical protein KDK_63280 [Dictyobacter kobayashii]
MATGDNSSEMESANMRLSDRYCIAAIIFFSLAIFFLSVVVFIFNPQTILGMLATGVGILLMLGCIFCFARYSHYLKKEEEKVSTN